MDTCIDHDWPAELSSDARCESCGLEYGQWSEPEHDHIGYLLRGEFREHLLEAHGYSEDELEGKSDLALHRLHTRWHREHPEVASA